MAEFLDRAGLITLWAKIKEQDASSIANALENYPTKTDIVEQLTGYVTNETLTDTVQDLEQKIEEEAAKVFVFKGNVTNYTDLPTENVSIGDVYNIKNADPENDIQAGDNVVWTGDEWAKLAGSVDLSNYATKEYVDNQTSGKVDQTIAGTNGTSYVWNESSGGGARFVHNDGTESFVGVNDGGENGMVAQIYADKQVDGNWVGTRINVYQKGAYYHNAKDKASEDYVADDPDHEIATIGDIKELSADNTVVQSLPDQFLTDIVNVSRTDTTNTAEIRIYTKQEDGTYSPNVQHGVLTLVAAGEVPGAGTGAGLMTVADKNKLDSLGEMEALTEEELLKILV